MCASTYPTISLVYPMYNHLMDHAEKIMKDGKSSKSLVTAAMQRWHGISLVNITIKLLNQYITFLRLLIHDGSLNIFEAG